LPAEQDPAGRPWSAVEVSLEVATQMQRTETGIKNEFPPLKPDFKASGELNITCEDLADQDIKGFILPCHLTGTEYQTFFSRKAAQLLRHQAEERSMLYKDSNLCGIVSLENFCPAWVTNCVHGVPTVRGESRDRTRRSML
jgi:hypothetical protein